MKTSIPADVWETKRSQIAVLYKEEEWPLKQVIKKIRTKDFNPTETQLRSRLKKWGVTKPSRQKRKKLSNQTTSASTAANWEHGERERKRDSAPQLLPLPIHASCSHDPESDGHRQLAPAANLPHQTKGEPCWENGPVSATITPSSEAFLHATGNTYAHYPGTQSHQDVAQLPPFCHPYDYPPYTTAPTPHCIVESTGSTSHRGSLCSSKAVSPANSLQGTMSISWAPQESQVGAETVSTAFPASLWNYTPPAPCQPCSPTCLYLAEGVPLSPGAQSDYTKHVLTDNAQKYPPCQNLSPSSDINFWEAATPYRSWRNSSASSDQIVARGSLKIDCGETRASHQSGMSRRSTLEALVGDGQDTSIDDQSRSPTLLPELTSSVSDSDACFPDLSPMEGTDLEYILPSPVMS